MNSTDARKFKSKNAVKIEYNGKNLSLTDWERETGISRHILAYRLNAGWAVEDIFNTKVSENKNLFFIRYDDSKDFTPENCTFMAEIDARSFKSSNGENYILTYNNKTMTIIDWSKKLGISLRIIRRRLKSGWSIEDTLCTPVDQKRKNL